MAVKQSVFVDNQAPACDASYLNSSSSEINNAIQSTGVGLSVSNLNQLASAISVYTAGSDFYNDVGSANSYSLSPVGAKSTPTEYFSGMRVRFFPNATSTGDSTINVNNLGSKDIVQADGVSAISAGVIVQNIELQLTYDGVNFRATVGYPITAATIPTGTMLNFEGSTAPSGFLLCYGQAVSRTTYSNLFAVMGTQRGVGDGSTTFNLPDPRGRTAVGADNMGGTSANRVTGVNADILNNIGFGSETGQGTNSNTQDHVLDITEIPEHEHDLPSDQTGSDDIQSLIVTAGVDEGFNGTNLSASTGGGLGHNHGGSTWTGVTGANVQPSITTNMIIKF